MSKKKANEDESLSLTGSHVDLRPLSGQRPRSAKWTGQPGPAESALRSKPNAVRTNRDAVCHSDDEDRIRVGRFNPPPGLNPSLTLV